MAGDLSGDFDAGRLRENASAMAEASSSACTSPKHREQRVMREGLYGDHFARLFSTIQNPHPPAMQSLEGSNFAAVRLTYSGSDLGPSRPSFPDEAFGICLRLRRQRADMWMDGRYVRKGERKGEASIYDLRSEEIVHFKDPFDFLYFYIPRSALDELAEEQGIGHVGCDVAPGRSLRDPILAHLGMRLLPALERPHEVSEMFLGSIATALHAHFLRRYAGARPVRMRRSGLAPWQLRRATTLMDAHLDGRLALSCVASECNLSTGHFARAFTTSMGKPPHRWLIDRRIDRGKQLLLDSALSATEIAHLCGFSDQSHFIRVFSAKVGASPGRWREARKA